MPPPPLVSIVIATVNTPRLTSACLKSVLKNTAVPCEIVVINNSRARAIRKCLAGFKRIRIIQNPRNLGYTQAANQGILASKGRFLCFLNSDTRVPPRWLERLLEVAEKPRVGAAGPRTAPNDFRWPAHDPKAGEALAALFEQLFQRYDRRLIQPAEFLTGFCLLIPRRVIDRAGLFDERYFFGWEDIDYSLRLRLLGYRLLKNCSLFIYHQESGSNSAPKRRGLVRQSERQFIAKWKSILRSSSSGSQELLREFNGRLQELQR